MIRRRDVKSRVVSRLRGAVVNVYVAGLKVSQKVSQKVS